MSQVLNRSSIFPYCSDANHQNRPTTSLAVRLVEADLNPIRSILAKKLQIKIYRSSDF